MKTYVYKQTFLIIALCLLLLSGCGSPDTSIYRSQLNTESSSAARENKAVSKKDRKKEEKKKTDSTSSSSSKKIRDTSSSSSAKKSSYKNSYSPDKTRKEFEGIYGETSGFYRKLNKGDDVNVLINGDSIGA